MNTPTGVDRSAPVIAHHEVDIRAPIDTVWQLHTDVNAWPTWQTDITAAHTEAAFTPGSSFDWTSYGFSVTSTIYDVVERARVLWGGTAGGITGVHEWIFVRHQEASTSPRRSPSPAIPSTPTQPACSQCSMRP